MTLSDKTNRNDTEVLTFRFLLPDLRVRALLPYAGKLSRISFYCSSSVARARVDDSMLAVLYLDHAFLVTTMPDILDQGHQISKASLAELDTGDFFRHGPCWFIGNEKQGHDALIYWFFKHDSPECQAWAMNRTAGEGDADGLSLRLMAEFVQDGAGRRIQRLADVHQHLALE